MDGSGSKNTAVNAFRVGLISMRKAKQLRIRI
jgi:hypothetical protein